ncbi:hypothetical protein VTO42DRAFT_1163 [Malbranchea cinnamomea]
MARDILPQTRQIALTTRLGIFFFFDHCTIAAASGSLDLDGQVFLGRPWRQYARVMYQDSEITGIVHPEGWTTMAEGAVL